MQIPRRTLVNTLPPPSPDSTFPAAATTTTTNNNNNPPPSSGDVSPSIMITVLVLAIAVILSASLYLLLRFLRRHSSSSTTSTTTTPTSLPHRHSNSSSRISPVEKNPLIDSLPLFTYDSLSSSAAGGGDCAVCLSKFEPKDSLRLLPICCHAFHAECIDTWLSTNQSCPLCRSPLFLPESHLLSKFASQNDSHSLSSSSRSFRVEIGNVSRRLPNSDDPTRRTFSIGGNFEYILDDTVSEVPAGSFRRPSDFKVDISDDQHQQQQGALAAEVGTRGGWLKDYLSYSLSSTSSSRTTSFRGSGRWFFTGSSRRSAVEFPETRDSDLVVHAGLETSQFSDEIGELFRWLSGV